VGELGQRAYFSFVGVGMRLEVFFLVEGALYRGGFLQFWQHV
jgi:hypothetical protein